MKVVIIDDDPGARERLALLLSTLPAVEVVGKLDCLEKQLEYIEKIKPDAIYLDVELEQEDGIETAHAYLKRKDIEFIVMTSYPDNAIRAYEIRPLDFLLKPFNEESVLRSISRLSKRLKEKEQLKQVQKSDRLFSKIAHDILEGLAIEEVLNYACQETVDIYGLPLAWIGSAKLNGDFSIDASAGSALECLDTKDITWNEIKEHCQPLNQPEWHQVAGKCYYTAPSFHMNELFTEQTKGIRHCILIPLKREEQILGLMALYAKYLDFLQLSRLNDFKHFVRQLSLALSAALRQREIRMLTTAVQASANAVLITDSKGEIYWCNHAFTKLTGYSLQEVTGKKSDMFRSHSHEENFYEQMWDSISSGKIWKGEVVNRHKSGHYYTEEMTITPIINGHDQVCSFIAIKEDISIRKETEKALQHAKAKAEKADLLKSDFLSVISHELRTPMNGVLGMGELLLDTALDEEQQYLANTLMDSAHKQLKLIEAMLTFSDISKNEVSKEDTIFSLQELIISITEKFRPLAEEKNLIFSHHLYVTGDYMLQGAHRHLQQILDCLLENAIKFTHKGTVSVEATMQKETAQDIWICFSVIDSGIGFSPEVKERLFLPFTPGDSSSTRSFGGLGLGLAISKKLVDFMDGDLDIKSKEGEGTIVSITLPFQKASYQILESLAPTN
ncbi:ATP-binding protein [Heliorestis acidaminivorans]|uniref:ATP-binding protein n=1 Tax=Heliorestis acidaminivorans TaxID=553427 RepID=UPI001478BE4E|nr:ATP-binding protein [Heliorestis acidaminivorans]